MHRWHLLAIKIKQLQSREPAYSCATVYLLELSRISDSITLSEEYSFYLLKINRATQRNIEHLRKNPSKIIVVNLPLYTPIGKSQKHAHNGMLHGDSQHDCMKSKIHMIFLDGDTSGKCLSNQTRTSGLCDVKSNLKEDPGCLSKF